MSAQSDASAAAASLLTPNLPLNNLVTLAAMAQQPGALAAAAASQPTAAQLTNAATSLCKYKPFLYKLYKITLKLQLPFFFQRHFYLFVWCENENKFVILVTKKKVWNIALQLAADGVEKSFSL